MAKIRFESLNVNLTIKIFFRVCEFYIAAKDKGTNEVKNSKNTEKKINPHSNSGTTEYIKLYTEYQSRTLHITDRIKQSTTIMGLLFTDANGRVLCRNIYDFRVLKAHCHTATTWKSTLRSLHTTELQITKRQTTAASHQTNILLLTGSEKTETISKGKGIVNIKPLKEKIAICVHL